MGADETREPQDTSFTCTNCGAHYKVIRVEGASATDTRELTCIRCDARLDAREGEFVLKYFLMRPQVRPRP
jgi:hypothetical protein